MSSKPVNRVAFKLILLLFVLLSVYYYWIYLPSKTKKTWHAIKALEYSVATDPDLEYKIWETVKVPHISGTATLVSKLYGDQWLFLNYLQRDGSLYVFVDSRDAVPPSEYCANLLKMEEIDIGRKVRRKLESYCNL